MCMDCVWVHTFSSLCGSVFFDRPLASGSCRILCEVLSSVAPQPQGEAAKACEAGLWQVDLPPESVVWPLWPRGTTGLGRGGCQEHRLAWSAGEGGRRMERCAPG